MPPSVTVRRPLQEADEKIVQQRAVTPLPGCVRGPAEEYSGPPRFFIEGCIAFSDMTNRVARVVRVVKG